MTLRTAREIEDERLAFKAARIGHNDGGPIARANPTKLTYLAHGKGYVMVRHPNCQPFAITEALWLSFPRIDGEFEGKK